MLSLYFQFYRAYDIPREYKTRHPYRVGAYPPDNPYSSYSNATNRPSNDKQYSSLTLDNRSHGGVTWGSHDGMVWHDVITPKNKKKSVRWADDAYEETLEKQVFTFRNFSKPIMTSFSVGDASYFGPILKIL